MRTLPKCMAFGVALIVLGWGAAFAGPVDSVQAVPEEDDDALVFSSATDVELTIKTANHSETDAHLLAAVRPFKGEPVSETEAKQAAAKGETVVEYGVSKFYRIETFADQTIKSGETVVKAGSEDLARINLGKLPPGFYMLDISLFDGAMRLSNRKYPLAVLEDAEPQKYEPPVIPLGVYTRFMTYKRSTEPLFWKTYVHAIAHDLRKHNLNMVVASGGFHPGEVEIFNSYGVAGISRGGGLLDHPGVIASFVSDEPHPGEELEKLKQTYADLHKKYADKIITTCMVGEGMGLGAPGDPVNLWKELQPKVRVFRWYGIKKHFYDALHPLHYKGVLPFTSVLRIAEASSDIPWWVILPAFGKTGHEAYFQNPSPAQMRSMMHLACAYGADGILLYEYQFGLVDPVTLKPRDGKFAAVAEVAAKIKAHTDLIISLGHIGLDVRCPDPVVDAIPLESANKDGKLYAYVVNKDAKNPVSTRLLLWAERWVLTSVRDVYSGKNLEIGRDEEGYLTVPLTLAPGEGQLLATDVANAKQ